MWNPFSPINNCCNLDRPLSRKWKRHCSTGAVRDQWWHLVMAVWLLSLRTLSATVHASGQWRRNRGFRRFNEPGPRSSWGPEWWGHRKILGKILRKIIKIVTTRWRILRLKCTKFDFGWGSAPDPAGGAYSAPPDLLARFGGCFAAGGGAGLGKDGREREGPPSYCWTRSPRSLATPLQLV